jgi:hypothetical protein
VFVWARNQRAFEQGLCTDSPLADSGDGGTCSRDARILAEWKKHPGLGPSQIRNQLRRGGFKVSVPTVHMVMEQHGYVTPKVKRTKPRSFGSTHARSRKPGSRSASTSQTFRRTCRGSGRRYASLGIARNVSLCDCGRRDQLEIVPLAPSDGTEQNITTTILGASNEASARAVVVNAEDPGEDEQIQNEHADVRDVATRTDSLGQSLRGKVNRSAFASQDKLWVTSRRRRENSQDEIRSDSWCERDRKTHRIDEAHRAGELVHDSEPPIRNGAALVRYVVHHAVAGHLEPGVLRLLTALSFFESLSDSALLSQVLSS